MEKSNPSSTNVELAIVHSTKGRVRLRVKGDNARKLLLDTANHLRSQAGILQVAVKPASNSLVVNFDPNTISIEQLTKWGEFLTSKAASTSIAVQSTNKSNPITYDRLLSLIPPLVGLGIARGLKISGWKSILTYILAAGTTREIIALVREESPESENVDLSSIESESESVSTTEVLTEEISSLLRVIETDFEIVHQIPGRIRLRVPQIGRDIDYARKLQSLLEQDNRIIDTRFKTNSNSVVILYDPQALSNGALSKAEVLRDRNSNKTIQSLDESEKATISHPKNNNPEKSTELTLEDSPSPEERDTSEPTISATAEQETAINDNVETERESITPMADDKSDTETAREFSD